MLPIINYTLFKALHLKEWRWCLGCAISLLNKAYCLNSIYLKKNSIIPHGKYEKRELTVSTHIDGNKIICSPSSMSSIIYLITLTPYYYRLVRRCNHLLFLYVNSCTVYYVVQQYLHQMTIIWSEDQTTPCPSMLTAVQHNILYNNTYTRWLSSGQKI
jgi:hypothetical protein